MTKKAVSKSASCCWEVSWWHLHDNIAHDVVDVLPDQVLRWQLHEIVAHVVDVLPDQVLWWQLHESVAQVVVDLLPDQMLWWQLYESVARVVVDLLPDQVLWWQLHESVAHVVVDLLPDQVLWWQLHKSVAHVVDLGVGGHLSSSSKGPAGAAHTLHMQKYWYIVNCPIYTESQTTHNTGLNY